MMKAGRDQKPVGSTVYKRPEYTNGVDPVANQSDECVKERPDEVRCDSCQWDGDNGNQRDKAFSAEKKLTALGSVMV